VNEVERWLAADILSLGMAADAARRSAATVPIVSYQRVHLVSPAAIAGRHAVPDAASEVRVYELPASLDDAVSQLQALKVLAGPRRVSAYSMTEIEERARSSWKPLPDTLAALAGAGLADVAAEMPADQLGDLTAAMRALSAAGLSPRRITVSRPVGERKAEVLARMRDCIDAVGHPLHVSPLPRHPPAEKPTTGYEDLRMVALARLMVATNTASPVRIEVDWSLYGPKLAQVALTFGADHLDAVAATSDASLGRRRETVEEVERNIRAAGFEPQEMREFS
jgi:aminodeoxyfutalosine synthase